MLNIRTILHPTDFSDFSNHAFRLACSLAHDHGARLIVAHVIPESAVPMGGVMTPPPAEEYAQAKENLEKIRSPSSKMTLERRLLVGDPVAEICRLAQARKAGLIILGTHGRTGLNRFLMGSVAEYVVRNASCPVLTVRIPIRIVPSKRARAKAISARRTASILRLGTGSPDNGPLHH